MNSRVPPQDERADEGAAGALWTFAVDLYQRPGVAEKCLALQDRWGVDVPLLLFCLWLGARRGVVLASSELLEISASVRAWQTEIVTPLREMRRRLKLGPGPAPTEETASLRERIKAVELDAERIELAFLERLSIEKVWSETSEPARHAARRNLSVLLAEMNISEEVWSNDGFGDIADAL